MVLTGLCRGPRQETALPDLLLLGSWRLSCLTSFQQDSFGECVRHSTLESDLQGLQNPFWDFPEINLMNISAPFPFSEIS